MMGHGAGIEVLSPYSSFETAKSAILTAFEVFFLQMRVIVTQNFSARRDFFRCSPMVEFVIMCFVLF